MDGQRVLVTGGAGFIGSTLANHLAESNEVIAIDDLYLGTPENINNSVEFHNISVLDDDIPVSDDIDVLFHLAALSSRNMHEEHPQQGVRVNIEGFVNTVEQVRGQCDTVVYASTSSVYGSQTEPSPEDMEITARTGYEASKLAREKYAEYYSTHYEMTMAGLRFFAVYQGYGGAEAHKGEYANTVAQFADDIANGRSPELYGDGSQTRDYTHVDDIVRGIELAADHRLDGIYNLGTGESYDFNTVVELLNDELGTAIEPVYIETPFDDYVHDTLADNTKMTEATGWEPQIDFEEGVKRVCAPYT